MSNSHIEGLEAWFSHLNGIPERLLADVRQHVGETAYKIEADAKLLCPVDTGRLSQSIHTSFDLANQGYIAKVGTNVEYCEAVEFGTIYQHSQPYMIPAFNKWKPKFIDGLNDIFKRVGD